MRCPPSRSICWTKVSNTEQDPETTIVTLLDTHFPGNHPSGICSKGRIRHLTVWILKGSKPFISKDIIRWPLTQFKDTKTTGPDSLKPVVLNRVAITVNSSSYTGYVPEWWQLSKVIFIPKPGKDDSSKAKSFRPINSTVLFFFKIFEKLVLWNFKITSVSTNSWIEISTHSGNDWLFAQHFQTRLMTLKAQFNLVNNTP